MNCAALFFLMAAPLDLQQGLGSIVAEGAEVQKVIGGFTKASGPMWTGHALLVCDGDAILLWSDGKPLSEYFKPSGFATTLASPMFGELVAGCPGKLSKISSDLSLVTLVERLSDRPIGAVTSVAASKVGAIYFSVASTPSKGKEKVDGAPPGLYGLLPATTSSTEDVAIPVAQPLMLGIEPGALALSGKQDKLFWTLPAEGAIHVASRTAGGSLAQQKLFAMVPHLKAATPPALCADRAGNVFCGAGEGIQVLDSAGKLLGRIECQEAVTGLAFGGKDGVWLYITTATSLYRLQTKTGVGTV